MRLLILFLFFPFLTYAQINISGKIIDQSNNQPLSFASIAVPNSTTGTMSNDGGQFEIRLKEDQTEIQISYIGYVDTLIVINPDIATYEIQLKPYEVQLTEITVRPLSPLEYIIQALEKYPSLIPTEPFETRSFFATRSSIANDKSGSYKLEEAVFKTYYTDFANDTLEEPSQLILYRSKNEGEFTSILEENKRLNKMAKRQEKRDAKNDKKEEEPAEEVVVGGELEESDTDTLLQEGSVTININDIIGAGPEALIRDSKNVPTLDFFNSEFFKKFSYTFGEQTFYQGRELIKIDFSNKRKVEGGFYKGSVYLDHIDLSIVALDYNARAKIPFYINALLKTIVGFSIDSVERDVSIRNQNYQDLWYPKEVISDLRLTLKQKKRYETIATAQILNIEEIVSDSPNPIPEDLVFDKELEMSEHTIDAADGIKWENINVISFEK